MTPTQVLMSALQRGVRSQCHAMWEEAPRIVDQKWSPALGSCGVGTGLTECLQQMTPRFALLKLGSFYQMIFTSWGTAMQ